MNEPHIASAFDRDLEAIQAMLMKMGGLVETSILQGAESLERRDLDLAEVVRASDEAIDALEVQLNEEATRVIALRQPAASDLRTVMTVIKISSNLERIGDHSKNMAKRTTALSETPPVGSASVSIRKLAREVQLMLKDALDSYIQHDAELAYQVIERDKDVDQLYDALFRDLLTHMMEDPRNITSCMHLHFVAKNCERMGDHVTNIAEQVIYLVSGELPDETRSKLDETAFYASSE